MRRRGTIIKERTNPRHNIVAKCQIGLDTPSEWEKRERERSEVGKNESGD